MALWVWPFESLYISKQNHTGLDQGSDGSQRSSPARFIFILINLLLEDPVAYYAVASSRSPPDTGDPRAALICLRSYRSFPPRPREQSDPRARIRR